MLLDRFRQRLARLIAPKKGAGSRMYAAARSSRLTAGWTTSNSSADTELHTSLKELRSRSRALMRDAPYAKRARTIVVNNVIGGGVGVQAQVMTTRGVLSERVNAAIEEAWCRWARATSCHTGGELHFADLERMAMAQVFEAGEIFIRKHYQPFGDSKVPLALEIIEAERLADEMVSPGPLLEWGNVRMGVESDRFGRPVAYWIRERHPSDLRAPAGAKDRVERVPADQIIHLRLIDRWPQTRGEPWLHSVIRKLNDMDGYTEAEITAARAAACYMGVIESDPLDTVGAEQEDGSDQITIEPAIIRKMNPGEKMNWLTPTRPNTALDPFMRYMLREVAAGVGVSYESLSRDYSQSNYSSSRLALLDDRDLWRVLQMWWVRSFREPLHREWLRQAVYARAIEAIPLAEYVSGPEKFEPVRWKLRGWSWVDPTKEVEAFKEAVRAGFTTTTAVIAQTAGGVDIEDVIAERKRELEMFDEAGIDVDTTVPEPVTPDAPGDGGPDDPAKEPTGDPSPARVFNLPR